MNEVNRSAQAREVDYMKNVDVHPDVHRATEPDEDQVLRELYGEPDDDGIFRADGPAEPVDDPPES
ncbi:hypothetical protein ACGFNU_19280 [Spirillospora sp. NPDC048911]|uniref:hypothetical protein n=1 Tax=Spirillospora sp. NPDC048911 TaxID=3364527 RepID=UPI00371A7348